jgi:hypothetical protein
MFTETSYYFLAKTTATATNTQRKSVSTAGSRDRRPSDKVAAQSEY